MMDDKYKEYQQELKKEHRFGFWNNPSYEELITKPIKKHLFLPLAEKVVELLGWEIYLKENDTIHARPKEKWETQGKIKIEYLEYSKIRVCSESALDQRWDNGKNSLRVKLFIKVFFEELEALSEEQKSELEKEFEIIYNWDDYEIPETLPEPPELLVVSWIPIVGSLLAMFVFGMATGFIDYQVISGNDLFGFINFLFVPEVVTVTAFYFIITRLCKIGNFTDLKIIPRLYIFSLILYFLSAEFTFYVLLKYPWIGITSFFEFEIIYYEPFFTQQDLMDIINYIAIVVFVIISLPYVAYIKLESYIVRFSIDRVPEEVFNFVEYLLVKNKTEVQIRYELSKRGWSTEQDQNKVFEAVQVYLQVIELSKN